MNRTPTSIRAALTAAGILVLAGAAFGQNALGGGRALDGGLSSQPGGRVNAQVSDLQSIIRVNTNAGNALNGPGYAGSYNRGSSFTSSTLGGSGLLNRSTSPFGSSLGSPSYEQFDRIAVLEAGYLPNGSLTSTVTLPQGAGATDYRRGGDPYVGFIRDGQGGVVMARGSALRGLNLDPISRLNAPANPDAPKVGTASTYDRVIDELRRASIARALDNPNRVNTAVTPTPTNANPATTPKPPTDNDRTLVKAPPAANPANPANTGTATPGAPVQYDPEASLRRLRERLNPKTKPAPSPAADRTRQPDGATTADPSNNAATASLTEEDINALRGMGLKLDTLVPPGANDAQATDGYTRLGQESLTAGRFGLADEMFQAALSRSPGNAMAQAGRIHATMGLGLLMTAGTDLRAYFVEHPEMIPIRFNSTLLVPPARAEQLAQMLIADIGRTDGSMLNNGGLTLAYLGRQFDNPTWLAKGFSAMATQTKGDAQGTELLSILKRVWGDPATAPVPAPTKTEPAKPEPSK